ncbi:zincin-like metallopeptidase domain-containing protein (plasmid) [Pseudomonas viciae]|uniref:Zincin-like metallopeptidase domain-containing protein n=1 Tax=Pseudomonas viciae TaxID=2505979 RepID=A0ABY8PME9_9PSED|nr:zincin-like metallopeptidase domain-containing protein [Pseudomonas viciae]WGO96395.1 zincin-like metallopeptidase domain-containing protein [Pseudomonas viciae]
MSNEFFRTVADKVIEQLKQGSAPWLKPWNAGESFMPFNPTTGNAYRSGNAIWLMTVAQDKGYSDSRWLTLDQAAQAGAKVRESETGTQIQFWKWQGMEPVTDKQGMPILDEQGKQKQQLVRYERPRVMSAVVFNADQIDGLPKQEDRPALPEWQRHGLAETMLAAGGADIRYEGDRAFYLPSVDRITLPAREQFATPDAFYATALHAKAHWTGHESRLDRDLSHPFGSEGYAKEEMRAGIASMILGEQLGIGHDPAQHAAYTTAWVKALQEDPREIYRAAADAERIAKHMHALTQEQNLHQAAQIPADSFVVAVQPDGQPRIVNEYSTIGRAVDHLKTLKATDQPAIYLRPNGDRGFDGRLAQRPDPAKRFSQQFDPAFSPLIYSELQSADGQHQVTGVAQSLTDLVNNQDPAKRAELEASSKTSIEQHKLRHFGIGRPDGYQDRWKVARPPADAESETVQIQMPVLVSDKELAVKTHADRTFLAVPFEEKDEAKSVAKANGWKLEWDSGMKAWWAPEGADMTGMDRWQAGNTDVVAHADPTDKVAVIKEQFAAALREAGLILDGPPEMDGELKRVRVEGDKRGEKKGAYVGFTDGWPAGFIQNYNTGVKHNWKLNSSVGAISAKDRAKLNAETAQRREAREHEREAMFEKIADALHTHLAQAVPATGEHVYLQRKGIDATPGLLVDNVGSIAMPPGAHKEDQQQWSARGNLIVPIHDMKNGKLIGAQSIDSSGRKSFPRGGKINGGCHMIGDPESSPVIIVSEGYATGRTLHDGTDGVAVAVAFFAGNLANVAIALRERYPDKPIFIGGDNDHRKPLEVGPNGKPKENVGKLKAEEAAHLAKGQPLLPMFEPDDIANDWNDLYQLRGMNVVRDQLRAGMAIGERHQIAEGIKQERQAPIQDLKPQQAQEREKEQQQELQRGGNSRRLVR